MEYRDLIFDICYIATCFRSHSQLNFPLPSKNYFILRDDPKIWQLYNGLSCAEIPVKQGASHIPNGSCNGDKGQCVVPSTPGNLTSACPNEAGKQFPKRVAKRKMRKGHEEKRKQFPRRVAKRRMRKGHKKQRNNRGSHTGRLVGPSTLHTHERTQALRYPWI